MRQERHGRARPGPGPADACIRCTTAPGRVLRYRPPTGHRRPPTHGGPWCLGNPDLGGRDWRSRYTRSRMDDLYRDYILEHYRRPHNFGVVEDADASYEGANPLCGDRITLMLGVKDGRRRSGRVHRARLRHQPGERQPPDRRDQGQAARRCRRVPRRRPARPARHRHQPGAPQVRDAQPRHAPARPRATSAPPTDAGAPQPPRPRHDRGHPMAPLQVSPAGLTAGVSRTPGPVHLQADARTVLIRPDARREPRQPVDHPELMNPMPKSYADLLREARARSPRSRPQEVEALAGRAPPPSSTSARRPSGSRATSPAPPRLQELHRAADRGRRARPRRSRVVLYCAGGVRSLFAAQTLPGDGLHDVALHGRRLPGLEGRRPRRSRRRSSSARSRSSATAATCSSRRSARRARRSCSAVEGPAHRRRRPRQPGGAVPRGGGRRHDRHRRLRRRRPVATSSARSSTPPTGVGERKVESRADRRSTPSTPTSRSSPTRRCSSRDNVERLIAGYDVILDGTDTFETRYILNDAAVAAGIPVVHASRSSGSRASSRPSCRTRGRATAACTRPRRRPSSRPAAPWPACWASCPGSWACSRPTRRSRSCSASASTLAGRLLLFDALETEFTELQLRRDPHCPVCSDEAVAAREAGAPLAVASVGADAPFLLTTTGSPARSPEARA